MNSKPHCAEHPGFQQNCPVCRRALAATQPYPVQPGRPNPPRSYGYTDDITEDTFKPPGRRRPFATVRDAPEPGLSRSALRLILKLIWPFARWDI